MSCRSLLKTRKNVFAICIPEPWSKVEQSLWSNFITTFNLLCMPYMLTLETKHGYLFHFLSIFKYKQLSDLARMDKTALVSMKKLLTRNW